MGAVSCYIEHVITIEFVSEFAFVSLLGEFLMGLYLIGAVRNTWRC